LITLTVHSRQRTEFIDITGRVEEALGQAGLNEGAVVVYVPHTTAACTINENADPDVVRDMTVHLARSIPEKGDYRHGEGNSDSHIKASLFGASQHVIVDNGRLVLGRWQGIYFCEFDGPRTRQVHLAFLKAYE
jgi:secondary thiamine-phosphate synthase enzyme